MFRPATTEPTPFEIVVFFLALIFGAASTMLGVIMWLAYQNPDKGYYWADFIGWFIASAAVTITLLGIAYYFLKQRFAGNPLDIQSESNYVD